MCYVLYRNQLLGSPAPLGSRTRPGIYTGDRKFRWCWCFGRPYARGCGANSPAKQRGPGCGYAKYNGPSTCAIYARVAHSHRCQIYKLRETTGVGHGPFGCRLYNAAAHANSNNKNKPCLNPGAHPEPGIPFFCQPR